MQESVDVSLLSLSANFKEALSSRRSKIINDLWDNNPDLAFYYSGQSRFLLATKGDGEIEQQWLQIPLSDAIVNLKRVLSSQCSEIIKKMWKNNTTLIEYYCGMAIPVLAIKHDGQTVHKTVQISTAELAANFRGALSSHCSAISVHMWEKSPSLASYFSGKVTEVLSTNEKNGQIEQKTAQIQFIELIANFKSAISGRNSIVINAMCENNLSLVSYYSGKSTSVLLANDRGELVQQTVQIATADLIANFKTVLPCCCPSFLESIWKDGETPLRLEVKKLPEDELKTLAKSVLSISGRGCHSFIIDFFHSISNRALLESMLSDLSSESKKRYVRSQIDYLNARMTLVKAPQESPAPLIRPKLVRKYQLFGDPKNKKRLKFHDESKNNAQLGP